MSRGADWFAFHATIDPVDTADALQTALADPQQRWYGLRRVAALAASGALTAASWNPNVHPRGKDGKFIERFAWVRWYDPKTGWETGWVSDIDPVSGAITVRSGGNKVEFPNAKNLYSRPKPKALIDLPDPTSSGTLPDKFKKIGGQGGSNPGALYEIDGSFADGSPDISTGSRMISALRELRQPGTSTDYTGDWNPTATPDTFVPTPIDTVMIPRVDGTKDRYDVVQRFGSKWYRVPASGQVTDDDLMRGELEVSPADAFGEVGSDRRHRVVADLGTLGITRGAAFDVEDVADMVQQAGSPLPGVGDKYYVKKMNIPERARSEALANDFYELLGVPVPSVAVGTDGHTISSKLVGDTVSFDPNNPDHVHAAQQGFVADAWTANWDVIGQNFDNIQIDSQGRAWRIDAGGSLEWRAQGKPKGSMFGDQVGELDSFRDKGKNPTAGKVYGQLTYPQMVEQATVLQSITPDQIQRLADNHDMGHVGPVMIARRKNILDQLGIVDPPPAPEIPPPPPQTSVPNPAVQPIQQLGAPPTVAVHNWKLTVDAIPATTLEATDWVDDYVANHAVFKQDGDLWVADGHLVPYGTDQHHGSFRNLFTGEKRDLTLNDGFDEFLQDYTTDNYENLIGALTPGRDAAVAEIVARTANIPIAGLSSGTVNLGSDPEGLRYGSVGLANWQAFLQANERGRFGKDGDRPLMREDGSLWEIDQMPASDTDVVKLTRRAGRADPSSWMQDKIALDQDSFASNGPWFLANNDTTAEIWKSKYGPDPHAHDDLDPDGQALLEAQAIEAADQQVDDLLALLGPDGHGHDTPGSDDGITDAAATPQADPVDQPDVGPVLAEGETTHAATDNASTFDTKIVHGVVAGLGPSEPILSTELAASDVDQIKADLLGKAVVTLPIESHDNPDFWTNLKGQDLGWTNGLGIVTEVSTEEQYQYSYVDKTTGESVAGGWKDVVKIKVERANGGYSWVVGGEGSKYKKLVIPISATPIPTTPTFKANGDIVINGEKVGTHWKPGTYPGGSSEVGHAYWEYGGIIDADHSITGQPMVFSASKQSRAKLGAGRLVVPILPKPTKPKSTKIQATEQDIKDLNATLASYESSIEATQQQLEDLAKAKPTSGNPLNDGTFPQQGDWVFSIKDGSYAQVKQVELKFGAKHKQDPANFLRVTITQPDGSTKTTLRSRNTLVSVAGPGQPPFVLQTKAIKNANGDWIGPGTPAYFSGTGGEVVVLDTNTGGNALILLPDGSSKWVHAQSYLGPSAGGTAPTLKQPGGTPDVDWLNSQLAALQDEKAQLVATIANTVVAKPKKKKPIGVPYPGPNGATYKQPAYLAQDREAKGLKNTKDGYVPTPGMILRHNDGTQYIVYQTGTEWSTHKNSVYVAPASSPTDFKWRALSTMVVDHETMLTDKNGDALPIVSTVEGADWVPESGMILRKFYNKDYWVTDPITHKSELRKKEVARFYIVSPDGEIYNLDGSKPSGLILVPSYGSPNPPERVGYLDKSAVGGKQLTVSIQQHHVAQVGQIEYAVIHDPDTAAAIPLLQPPTPTPPPPGGVGPIQPGATTPSGQLYVQVSTTGGYTYITPAAYKAAPAGYYTLVPSGNAPAPPVPTPTPSAPAPPPPAAPNVPTTVSPTPPDELPLFTGTNPAGQEMPHPPTTSSSAGVPTFQPQGGTPTLDVAPLTGTKAVTHAIAEATKIAQQNKANGSRNWVGTYAIADHDSIEDMMVRVQITRDAQGVEYIETSFRLSHDAARKAHTTFITSTTNQAGDWTFNNRNAKNLVPGDLMAVRVSGGGGATVSGGLRPDAEPGKDEKVPNATVIAAPILIGKNKDGTLDVYRTQVMTAGGDIGFIDLEDRNGTDTVVIAEWDPTKPRTTNGVKGLNPNAANDGWTVGSSTLGWYKATSGDGQKSEILPDGVKQTPGPAYVTSLRSYNFIDSGTGHVLTRDRDGVHIEYNTTSAANSKDGMTFIQVRADDPDAQRKISEAMEAVGVTKQDQTPPDAAALSQMAADKVYQQLNPTWSKNMKANGGIPDALAAIDSAVGDGLPGGRKANVDDISLRIEPDGRVQVLVSEDVSRALVKKGGVKQYYHRFTAAGWEAMLEQNMAGEQVGLMASTERFAHGLWFHGKSSAGDHYHDSADHMFLTLSKSSGSPGDKYLVVDPVTLHRQVDYYWRSGDNFGSRQSDNLNWAKAGSVGGGNEMMLKKRFEPALWGHVIMYSGDRAALIDKLHKRGITHAPNGMLLEDFFVESGGTSLLTGTPPSFGTEVPLTALTTPIATPAAPELVGV